MIKLEIKSIFGTVLFTYESEDNTLKETMRRAVLEGADLRGAVLEGADLRGADLRGAVLRGAVLRGAVLEGADLRGAVLEGADLRGARNIPDSYTNLCMRDMIYVMNACIKEVPYLKQSIIDGRVNGTQYQGDCCCLIGSLAIGKKVSDNELCSLIPYYDKGLHNCGEQWFWNIREGDTPDNSFFSQKALEACDIVLNHNNKE